MVEDVLHFFTACLQVSAAWSCLSLQVVSQLGCLILDWLLLSFTWPSGDLDLPNAAADAAIAEPAWPSRDNPERLLPVLVCALGNGGTPAACGIYFQPIVSHYTFSVYVLYSMCITYTQGYTLPHSTV
jgi:hypothetical protein